MKEDPDPSYSIEGQGPTFDGCYYARDADDCLLGFMGAVELLNEIQRIAHCIDGLWVDGEIARSTEFLGTVILREVPPKTPIQFFREQEKRLRVKHRIQQPLRPVIPMPFLRARGDPTSFRCPRRGEKYTAFGSLDTLAVGTAVSQRFMSNQVTYEGTPGKAHLLDHLGLCHSGRIRSRKGKLWYESGAVRTPIIEFPTQAIEAPITQILLWLRDRGLISSRPWPIHVAFMNVSDGEDIVNWSAGIAISPLSYYRCRDNLYQVRTIVDHQIRWSAIFTLAHKQKSSARKILNLVKKVRAPILRLSWKRLVR